MKRKIFNFFVVPLICLLFATNISAQITSLPYTQGFDSGSLPTGWTKGFDESCGIYNSSCKKDGSDAIGVYVTSGWFNASIVTPKIEVSGSITMSFDYTACGYNDGTLKIFYSTADNDYNANESEQLGNTISLSGTDWHSFEMELPEGTKYVELRVNGEGKEVTLDNFKLKRTSTCTTPSNIALNGTTISWTPGTATAWDIYVSDTAVTNLTSITTPTYNNTPFPLINLAPLVEGIKYYIYVRSNCGSEQSNWINFNFTAPCENRNLPFSQNFNAETYPIPCWQTKEGAIGNTLNNPYSEYSSWRRTSDPCELMKSGHAVISYYNNNQWLITPNIELENQSKMTFDLSLCDGECISTLTNAGNTQLKVLASTDNGSSWKLLKTFENTDFSAEPKMVEVDLSSLKDSTTRLAFFNGVSNNQALRLHIDNIFVEKITTCTRPTDVKLDAITATTAKISWESSATANTWSIYYSTTPIQDFTTVTPITATENPYTINNLTGQTQYYVYIQSDCGGGLASSYSQEFTFTTPCGAQNIPFIETFETYNNSQNSFPGDGCWNKFNSIEITSGKTDNGIYLSNTEQNGASIAILPMINANLNTLAVTFDAYCDPTGKIQLGIVSDINNANTFVPYGNPVSTSTGETWENLEIILGGYTGGEGYIALKFINGSNAYSASIDNVEVKNMGTCPRPSNLSISNLGENTATVEWTENGNSTAWVVEYGEKGFTIGSGAQENATDEQLTLTNLVADTYYDVYVKSNCPSEWSIAASFKTSCSGVDVPFIDSLNNYAIGTGINKFPANTCWQTLSTDDKPYIVNDNNAICMTLSNGSYAILPKMNSAINTLMIQFETRGSETGIFQVGVMSDPTDAETFEPIGNPCTNAITTTWNLHKVMLGSYTGSGEYIALKYSDPNPWYSSILDVVKVTEMPSCPPVAKVSVSNETATTAEVAWVANGSETEWNICLSTTPLTEEYDEFEGQPLIKVTENPFTLTDLDSSSLYFVYVQAKCGETETSSWSAETYFRTSCETVIVDENNAYVHNFNESVEGAPTCWDNNNITNIPTGVDADKYKWHLENGGSDGGNGGEVIDKCVSIKIGRRNLSGDMFDNDIPNYSDAIVGMLETPIFDLSNISQARLRFKYKNIYPQAIFNLKVSTDGGANYSNLDDITLSAASAWTAIEYDFSEYSGIGKDNIRLAFFASNGTGDYAQCQMMIDEFIIDTMPKCVKPSNLKVYNINSNSATVSWTEENDAEAWTVAYGESAIVDFATATKVNATTTSCTINGLNASTLYKVYVQSNCGSNGSSVWVGPIDFTTGCNALSLPFTESFDAESTTKNCWTINDADNDNKTWVIEDTIAVKGYSTENGNDYLVSPLLNISLGATIKFDYRIESIYNSTERFSVWAIPGYPENINNAINLLQTQTVDNEDFVTLNTISLDNFDNIAGNQFYIAIKCESFASSGDFIIDNFVVTGTEMYSITASAGEHGTITPSGSVSVQVGESKEFTITPDQNYKIATVKVDGVDKIAELVNNKYTFSNITENHTINATFDEVSIDEVELTSINIYPNPANDYINIEAAINIESIEVISFDGQVVDNFVVNGEKVKYNTEKLASGVYFVKISTQDSIITKRFTLEK